MSLLTPPSTAHRRSKDKENRDPDSNSRVVWSESNKIHILQMAGVPKVSTATSASKQAPTKSILKKCNAFLAPWPAEAQREITPEPADPLANLTYLEYPVSTIVQATEATELRVLIEAYSVLLARLRASVTGATDVDASWPLFQPLRKNTDAFVTAVARDLGRALVDPAARDQTEEPPLRVLLPSPKNTPKKKKRDGLSAEQVKYARDLCTTCHAVIRLLSLVLTLPAVQNIFTDAQLQEILTAVLAIPLADELPTPNARKTWALAIWLIQIQRLPVEVLAPAADRISLALCRGIDGELGKEGKKGSASDGLKAVHDLSLYLPSVFIPTFTHNVLSSVLATLLAPTLTLRTHAAHALGGFVLGATSLPISSIHAHISHTVSQFVTTPAPCRSVSVSLTSPSKLGSPTKSAQDPAIIRTLRTTLQATDVAHVAHGPVWATCVLASLLVLLGPAAMTYPPLRLLAQLGLRHKNRAVRALTAIMWRQVIWVFLQPRHEDIEGEQEVGDEHEERSREEKERRVRDEWWRLVASVTEFETGVCTIAAYLGSSNAGVPVYELPTYRYIDGEDDNEVLRRSLGVLYAMVCKDAATCSSAIDTMKQLVAVPNASSADEEKRTLLPRGLFSALPGLLSTEFTALKVPVNAIFDEMPKAEDVRSLTKEEVGTPWVWDAFVKSWKAAVGGAGRGATQGEEGEKEREELLAIWEGLLGMGLGAVLNKDEDSEPDVEKEQEHDVDAVAEFSIRAVDVIADILEDTNIALPAARTPPTPTFRTQIPRGLVIPGFTPSSPGSAIAKLKFARDLWRLMCRVIPNAMLASAAERLALCLVRNIDDYTAFGSEYQEEIEKEERNEAWAEFCVDVLAVCGGEGEAVRVFWGYSKAKGVTSYWTAAERALVWRVFAKGWMQQGSAAGWEGAACILAVPFRHPSVGREDEIWSLTTEDAKLWQDLLEHSVASALDYGHDANVVLCAVAGLVGEGYAQTHVRLVEFMLTYLGNLAAAGDLRELPDSVLDFVALTMTAAYPPPSDQTTFTWAMRAITNLVELCPKELVVALGEKMADALGLWIGDSEGSWDAGVVEYDILPLYQTLLIAIQVLPLSPSIIQTFSPVLGVPFASDARSEIKETASESFRDFWDATYTNVKAPEGGWGEDILLALNIVYGISEEKKDEHMLVEETPERPSTPISMTSPTVPTTPTTPSLVFSPRNIANTLSTPPRLRSCGRLFNELPHSSPQSPIRPRPPVFTRPPTPWTQRSSPTKRRKVGHKGKENMSLPERYIPSGLERPLPSIFEKIGVLDLPKPSPSKITLGKRRFEEDEVPDSEDERSVVASLVPEDEDEDVFLVAPAPPTLEAATVPNTVQTPIKKRKRMVLDAVELPSLSDVYRRPSLKKSTSFEDKKVISSGPLTRSMLRRTRSELKNGSTSTAGKEVFTLTSPTKRRRGSFSTSVFEESEAETEPKSSRGVVQLRELVPWPRMLYRLQPQLSSELSSDDDPHLGQVTPHHLMSPALRRVRGLSDHVDPPSDDSVMVPSPSRDSQQRRLQRQASLGKAGRVKPFVVG